ncbi:MAG TPA: SIMPL domain-containing protein [Acidiphilium sp.]
MKHSGSRIALGAAFLLMAAPFAYAAPASSDAQATTLDLAVTGSASHMPDAMLARLSATATTPTAAAAQRAVNTAMAEALQEAGKIKGLTATTDEYSVNPDNAKRTEWRAQQGLTLKFDAAPNAEAAKPVLALIGRLQAKGLLLEGLSGTLSPRTEQATRDAAIGDAVSRLRSEAAATAKALGEQPGRITHLRLNVASPIRPYMRAPMMMAAAAPAPVAQPGPVSEQVNLSATMQLQPASH